MGSSFLLATAATSAEEGGALHSSERKGHAASLDPPRDIRGVLLQAPLLANGKGARGD